MRAAFLRGFGAALLASTLSTIAVLAAAPGSAEAAHLWQGTVASDELNVRSAPHTMAPIVDVLQQEQSIAVVEWVSGEEVQAQNNTWARLGDERYVYSGLIHKDPPTGPPPLPKGVSFEGKWIDANLAQQVLTAYEGTTPVHVAVVSSGRPDYPSPQGVHRIVRRVYSETMRSASLPWVRDSYDLENVLFTQYYNEYGAAIHLAWWKSEDSFGIPTSHGCLGLPYEEAEWFWNWADEGVPVYVHDSSTGADGGGQDVPPVDSAATEAGHGPTPSP